MCAKLLRALNYYVRPTIYAEYTRKSRLAEDESKRHENKKGSCGWK